MPKLDLESITPVCRTGYPAPFDRDMAGRWQQRIGAALGLEHLGATLVTLKPGGWSSQRHWHHREDELAVMLSGEAVLVEDATGDHNGETLLRPGDICVWKAGEENGHYLQNRSGADCSFLAVSAGENTGGEYSDIDMKWGPGGFTRKDGTPY